MLNQYITNLKTNDMSTITLKLKNNKIKTKLKKKHCLSGNLDSNSNKTIQKKFVR